MCSKQGLCSEEGGLQHVGCLYNQHVLQPAQILNLQPLVRLRGYRGGEMLGREREKPAVRRKVKDGNKKNIRLKYGKRSENNNVETIKRTGMWGGWGWRWVRQIKY